MTTLTERLEAATEGSRELDAATAEAVGWCFVPAHTLSEARWLPPDWNDPETDRDFPEPPHYTTSLDAALTLVPEGWWWVINSGLEVGESKAIVAKIGNSLATQKEAHAATPALATSSAALKARGL